MKKFLALYLGTESALEQSGWKAMDEKKQKERQQAGIEAWMKWGTINQAAIVDNGAPLGKTKRTSPQGIENVKNNITGFVVVEAESHEAAAKLFVGHPHFMIFPGDSVEVMECLPLPAM